MHYAVPVVLEQAGLLGIFYTDVFLGNKPLLSKLLGMMPETLSPSSLRRLKGRDAPLNPRKVVSFDSLRIKTAWRSRRGGSRLAHLQMHAQYGREFCERIVKAGLNDGCAIYALNGAALELFVEAKNRGAVCILEQTIASRVV